MPPSSAKRIAALVVSRFGIDRACVRREVDAVLRGRGGTTELVTALVGKGLLSQAQAAELHALLLKPRATQAPDTAEIIALNQARKVASEPPPPPALRSIAGCRILRRLGEGGMGSVYLGYHEELKCSVAIKVLSEELADNAVCVDCFYRESRSSTLLDHPNVVRGITAGWDDTSGLHYLIREYVDGPSGHALLDRLGRLPVADAVHIALHVAYALEYLHGRQLVHRDIKPDNILLSSSGIAKLVDLGLVKRIGEARSPSNVQQGFGTSYYMPYEQAVNSQSVDGRSDIYALGATLYHMVTGQVPFPGEDHQEIVQAKDGGSYPLASSINPTVPPELDAILARMLARKPVDRYAAARDLIDELERTRLAALVPSFTGVAWDLESPRGAFSPNDTSQPTAFDLQPPGSRTGRSQVWYLRYRDEQGRWCKTKATTKQLMRRLRSGRMPLTAKLCAQPRGQFQPLTAFPAFRKAAADLSVLKSAAPRPGPPTLPRPEPATMPLSCRPCWLRFLRAGLAALVLVALLCCFLLAS